MAANEEPQKKIVTSAAPATEAPMREEPPTGPPLPIGVPAGLTIAACRERLEEWTPSFP